MKAQKSIRPVQEEAINNFREAFGTHANLSKVIGYRSIAGHVTCQPESECALATPGAFPTNATGDLSLNAIFRAE